MIQVSSQPGFPCAANSSWRTVRYFIIIIPINIVVPFLCIVATCVIVFKVARKQLYTIQAQVFRTQVSSLQGKTQDTLASSNEGTCKYDSGVVSSPAVTRKDKPKPIKIALKRRLKAVFREEARIAFATLAVVIGYLIAWTPYLISRLLYVLGQTPSNDVFMFGTVFVLSNSAWNPLLILLFRKDIRRSVSKICSKIIDQVV